MSADFDLLKRKGFWTESITDEKKELLREYIVGKKAIKYPNKNGDEINAFLRLIKTSSAKFDDMKKAFSLPVKVTDYQELRQMRTEPETEPETETEKAPVPTYAEMLTNVKKKLKKPEQQTEPDLDKTISDEVEALTDAGDAKYAEAEKANTRKKKNDLEAEGDEFYAIAEEMKDDTPESEGGNKKELTVSEIADQRLGQLKVSGKLDEMMKELSTLDKDSSYEAVSKILKKFKVAKENEGAPPKGGSPQSGAPPKGGSESTSTPATPATPEAEAAAAEAAAAAALAAAAAPPTAPTVPPRPEPSLKTSVALKDRKTQRQSAIQDPTPVTSVDLIPDARRSADFKNAKQLREDIEFFFESFPDLLEPEMREYIKMPKTAKKALERFHRKILGKLKPSTASTEKKVGIVISADAYIRDIINKALIDSKLLSMTPADVVELSVKGKDKKDDNTESFGSYETKRSNSGKLSAQKEPIYRYVPKVNEEADREPERSMLRVTKRESKVDTAKRQVTSNPFLRREMNTVRLKYLY